MPQVSDEEYAWLQTQAKTAKFAEDLYNDPQVGDEVKRAIKKKHPQLKIDGFDTQQYVEQKFAERDQKAAEQRKKRREDEENRTYQEKRQATQKKYGFTDEAMKKLEDAMIERNVADYEVAATWFAAQQPKTSTPFEDNHWNHEKREGFKEIAKNPEGWAHSELLKTMHDIEQRQNAF